MNVAASNPKKINWVKMGFIAILLAVAGYKYYQSNFAGPAVAEKQDEGKQFSDNDYKVDFNSDGANNAKLPANTNGKKPGGGYDIQFDPMKKSNGSSANSNSKPRSNQPYLSGGRNRESPAGLVYGMGGGGEHRTDHVLRHAEDQPNRRGTHGVFDADGDDVFRLIDEAYELIKGKSKQVKSEPPRDGKIAYVVDMKRKIGYKGGQSGKRAGHPKLYKVKLILAGGNRVITAYPY